MYTLISFQGTAVAGPQFADAVELSRDSNGDCSTARAEPRPLLNLMDY